MRFAKGAKVDDVVRVQRGGHAGKLGLVRERIDRRVFVVPFPGASWTAFWIDDADLAVERP